MKHKVHGYAFTDEDRIEIDSRLKGRKLIEITVHELLHLLFPKLEEPEIIDASITITNVLWNDIKVRPVDLDESAALQDGYL